MIIIAVRWTALWKPNGRDGARYSGYRLWKGKGENNLYAFVKTSNKQRYSSTCLSIHWDSVQAFIEPAILRGLEKVGLEPSAAEAKGEGFY